MAASFSFVSAASYSLEDFAEIFTRAFEGYYYPGITTAPLLAERARTEQIDFHRSQVLLDDYTPCAMGVLGLRSERAWCGGLGVFPEYRGQGLAQRVVSALIDQARVCGARQFGLEVLTRNERAIRTYQSAGLQIARRLQIFEWVERRAGEDPADWPAVPLLYASLPANGVTELPPAALLPHFARLHTVASAWQRDLASLLVRTGTSGLVLGHPQHPSAYLIYRYHGNEARILDLAALTPEDALPLLEALQSRYPHIGSVNEPAESPLISAYLRRGFVETDSQFEMSLAL